MRAIKNKRIVIAGGSSGIGLATALMALADGAEVIITGRDPGKLKRVVDSIQAFPVDMADRRQTDNFFKNIGLFDHLVIAVSGGKGAGIFRELDLDELKTGFEGKFWPQLNCLQAALPYINPQGSIVLITAISATSQMPGFSGLAAINSALESMVPVLAKELKPIRINAVSPGVINTSWWDSYPADVKKQIFDGFIPKIPAGKIGEPDHVAQAIISLLQMDYVTGRILPVDGGLSL